LTRIVQHALKQPTPALQIMRLVAS